MDRWLARRGSRDDAGLLGGERDRRRLPAREYRQPESVEFMSGHSYTNPAGTDVTSHTERSCTTRAGPNEVDRDDYAYNN